MPRAVILCVRFEGLYKPGQLLNDILNGLTAVRIIAGLSGMNQIRVGV